MPRKALALVRAALRFAQGATDDCGRGQQADDDRLPCDEARSGSKAHQSAPKRSSSPMRTGETLWDDNAPKATVTIVTS